MAKSDTYWQKRALQRLTRAEKSSVPYLTQIQKVYRNSARSVVQSVKEMYASYYRDDKTFSQDLLEEIEPRGNITRFMNEMAKAGLKTRLPENFKGRMNRLQMLEAQLWAESKKAAKQERSISTKSYENTITETYYRTIFDISKGTGAAPSFSTLDTRTINTILNTRFEGQNYSERIWGNSDKLANSLKDILAKAVATGQSPERTIHEVMERFGVARSNAARLVRTETNYFENRSELESYKELGIEKFQFLATLDERTSEICRAMDHEIFKVKDAVQGENTPPLHPYCVLPDTQVYVPDLYAATKSYYSGDVFEFRTADGRILRVTSNHIMLTTRGFVRAKFIRKGDCIIDYGRWREFSKGSPADNYCPITAEELFATFSKASGVSTTSMPASTEYLKGDVALDGNIDIVFVNSFFEDKRDVSPLELVSDFSGVFANVCPGTFFGNSFLTQLLMATALASDGIMSGASISDILAMGSLGHHESIRRRIIAQYDSRLHKTSVDDSRSNPEFLGKLISTLAGLIFSDNGANVQSNSSSATSNAGFSKPSKDGVFAATKNTCEFPDLLSALIEASNVVSVNRSHFEGHVYDFSTLSTLYLAEGFVSSNCRSTIMPVVDGWEPEARSARDSRTGETMLVENMKYEDWKKKYGVSEEISRINRSGLKPILGKNNLDAINVPQGKPMAQTQAMKGANPQYKGVASDPYSINCQRCVPTYEMRRRGYDVIANPNNGNINLTGKEFFVDAKTKNFPKVSEWSFSPSKFLKELEKQPDGRYAVLNIWKGSSHKGHTWVAEIKGGKVKFVDPQPGKTIPVEKYLSQSSRLAFYRMDNMQITGSSDIIKVFMRGKNGS